MPALFAEVTPITSQHWPLKQTSVYVVNEFIMLEVIVQ